MLTVVDCYCTLFAMCLTFCVSSVSKIFLEKLMWRFLFALLSGTSKGFTKLLLSISLVFNLLWFYFFDNFITQNNFYHKMVYSINPIFKGDTVLYFYLSGHILTEMCPIYDNDIFVLMSRLMDALFTWYLHT